MALNAYSIRSACVNKHDASYRLLFSNPAIVRGLFQAIPP